MDINKLLNYYLLTEASFDIWKKNHPNEDLTKAKTYFNDLETRYSALLHPLTKDLSSLSFEQLETLHQSIEKAREKNLKANAVQWLTKQIKDKFYIGVMKHDGTSERMIATGFFVEAPDWSPNGRYILYQKEESLSDPRLYIMDIKIGRAHV